MGGGGEKKREERSDGRKLQNGRESESMRGNGSSKGEKEGGVLKEEPRLTQP